MNLSHLVSSSTKIEKKRFVPVLEEQVNDIVKSDKDIVVLSLTKTNFEETSYKSKSGEQGIAHHYTFVLKDPLKDPKQKFVISIGEDLFSKYPEEFFILVHLSHKVVELPSGLQVPEFSSIIGRSDDEHGFLINNKYINEEPKKKKKKSKKSNKSSKKSK